MSQIFSNFKNLIPARTTLIITLCSLLLTACNTTTSTAPTLKQLEPFAPDKRYIIAVMPFEFKAGVQKEKDYLDSGSKLIDMAMVELFKTKRFRVVERSRISDSLFLSAEKLYL